MLNFVTTNPGKVREATEYLDDEVRQFDYDYPEVQADDLGTVAAAGARDAYRAADGPVIVDDAGLFIDAFDGFPGPYSSYVEDTVGVERVWRMTEPETDRAAAFKTVIAYCDGESFDAAPDSGGVDHGETPPNEQAAGAASRADHGERRGQDLAADERDTATTDAQVREGDVPVKLFEGWVPGEIVAPRGDGGFGFDPIFEHDGATFAEMSTEEKNAVSHRGRALAKFAEWYAGR